VRVPGKSRSGGLSVQMDFFLEAEEVQVVERELFLFFRELEAGFAVGQTDFDEL
jgi:hypothetical protein